MEETTYEHDLGEHGNPDRLSEAHGQRWKTKNINNMCTELEDSCEQAPSALWSKSKLEEKEMKKKKKNFCVQLKTTVEGLESADTRA